MITISSQNKIFFIVDVSCICCDLFINDEGLVTDMIQIIVVHQTLQCRKFKRDSFR